MDTLSIQALHVTTHIGVHAWEQRIKQKLLIDITIPRDLSACQDTLSNALDYDMLCKTVTEWVESQSFQLIETVANGVAALIQETFQVAALTVAVSKPYAVKNAGRIQVSVNRT